MKIQTVLYIDDDGVRHVTTIRKDWELNFLKMRFLYVRIFDSIDDFH